MPTLDCNGIKCRHEAAQKKHLELEQSLNAEGANRVEIERQIRANQKKIARLGSKMGACADPVPAPPTFEGNPDPGD